MLDTLFEVRGNKYMFSKIINLWGDEEISLYENGEILGYLKTEKYSVEEAEKEILENESFKESDLII
ncbi:hypothetical protein [Mammaliicoccus sciuri]|uniref:hypothetical protein n=1 Tax=Mammaliicoccus sciuri TaxID=1296 RepID=UPI001F24EAEF|nr:hypothetical protein [Mammaliicoccus sciuri]MCE5086089.1 hypothetical protein [Mammaliicoccus sciuri]